MAAPARVRTFAEVSLLLETQQLILPLERSGEGFLYRLAADGSVEDRLLGLVVHSLGPAGAGSSEPFPLSFHVVKRREEVGITYVSLEDSPARAERADLLARLMVDGVTCIEPSTATAIWWTCG